MPWAERVAGILEVWYPGTAGGEAIANLLFGRVNPSGHLPITFPRDESQLPRRAVDGIGFTRTQPFTVSYSEGAAGRLPLVRCATARAALPVRPRPLLHRFRL